MVWWKQAKYWLWIVVAVGLAILAAVLRSLFDSTGDKSPKTAGYGGLPPASEAIQQAAEQAQDDALNAKAGLKAVSDDKKQQLAVIGSMPDKKARRQALADFIKG
jgi:ABC-type Na+ efflux pump permease subunit